MLISVVEELIEDHYATVQLAPELRDRVEAMLLADLQDTRRQAETVHRDLTAQQQRLTHEQSKLLQTHYAGAVPLDLLKTEQDRISGQLETIETRLEATQTHFDTIETNLKTALDFASNCHRAYLRASDSVRRLFNQALFEQIFIEEDNVRVTLAEPFKTLLGPEVLGLASSAESRPDDSRHEGIPPPASSPDWINVASRTVRYRHQIWPPNDKLPNDQPFGSLKEITLVRPAGFEPATS